MVLNKLKSVLEKNVGFQTLKGVKSVLNKERTEIDLNISPDIISSLKHAPITSVDVERSFSLYKNILSDIRQNFSSENLEKHLVSNCFSQISNNSTE